MELIKVRNENGKQLVSGRELHEVLQVQQDYSDWIKKQLDNVDGIEGEDFTLLKGKTSELGGRPSIDYILTLDIAKEICMCVGVAPRTNKETKALSKQVRKYFIECEKQLQMQQQNNQLALTTEQHHILNIFEKRNNTAEMVIAIGEYGDFKYDEGTKAGAKTICDESIINQARVGEMINKTFEKEYEELGYVPTNIVSGSEFVRYLVTRGFYSRQRFPRKDSRMLEAVPHNQPTELFYDVFVNQGMAVAREVPDNRGKVITKFTLNIFNYISTASFKEDYMNFINQVHPNLLATDNLIER